MNDLINININISNMIYMIFNEKLQHYFININ